MSNNIRDFVIFYSVEFIGKDAQFNCWNQHTLTRSRVMAYISLFEAKMRYRKSNFKYRIREF